MTQQPGSESRAAQRRARREFIRAHHPDAGGNQQTFVTGLAGFDSERPPSTSAVTSDEKAAPQQAWPVSLTTVMLLRLRRRYDRFRSP